MEEEYDDLFKEDAEFEDPRPGVDEWWERPFVYVDRTFDQTWEDLFVNPGARIDESDFKLAYSDIM